MATDVKSAVITGTCTVIAALIPIVNLYLKNKELTKRLKYKTPGMAVAYYFSFIKRLFDYLNDYENLVIKNKDVQVQVDNKNAKLEILLPNKLDKDVFKESNKEFNKYYFGELYNGDTLLLRNIKYRKENDHAIITLDLPSILESAADYYSGTARTPNFAISEK